MPLVVELLAYRISNTARLREGGLLISSAFWIVELSACKIWNIDYLRVDGNLYRLI